MEFAEVHNLILTHLASLAEDAFCLGLVEASRTIPRPEELTFALTEDGELAEPAALGFKLESAPRYFDVARSAAAIELRGTSGPGHQGSFGDKGVLANNINKTLADHLYTEKGYYLSILWTKFIGAWKRRHTTAKFPAHLVNLCLKDAADRQLEFTEVGSGIGYVLPVVVALWTTRQCFIQQPELHLHPALQTSMGDAFIDAANQGRTVLVETHSEHILLRILRRVRQTHSEPTRASPYLIGPDDISIVYCEPSPDGTSRIVALGLTPEGDFIGRWPKGFFAERDQELFDE